MILTSRQELVGGFTLYIGDMHGSTLLSKTGGRRYVGIIRSTKRWGSEFTRSLWRVEDNQFQEVMEGKAYQNVWDIVKSIRSIEYVVSLNPSQKIVVVKDNNRQLILRAERVGRRCIIVFGFSLGYQEFLSWGSLLRTLESYLFWGDLSSPYTGSLVS